MDQYLIRFERILVLISFMILVLVRSGKDCLITSLCRAVDNICVADCNSEDCLGEFCQGFRGCQQKCLPGSHPLNSRCKTISYGINIHLLLLV